MQTSSEGESHISHLPAEPAPPDFVEADFTAELDLKRMLSGCAVLQTLVKRGLESRRLTHDEQVVVRHTLGHLPGGVAAVNYLFRRCPEVATETYLKSVLAGNPISCPKIRKRIPQVTSKLPCNCHFGDHLDHYPTPNLHLRQRAGAIVPASPVALPEPVRIAPTAPGPALVAVPRSVEHLPEQNQPVGEGTSSGSAEPVHSGPLHSVDTAREPAPTKIGEAARRFWQLTERAHRVGLELASAEHELLEALSRQGERHEDTEGTLEVVRVAGVPKIRFTPHQSQEVR